MIVLKGRELQKVIEADEYSESRQEYIERMINDGYTIYYPEDDELIIDLDGEEQFNEFIVRFNRMQDELSKIANVNAYFTQYESKTPGHCHVIIRLPMTISSNYERIALQAILGSDPTKEMLSIFRCWNDDPFPSLLCMKK